MRAITTSDNPRHGINPSMRRQIHTVLSNSFRAGFGDSLAAQQFSVNPPGHRADFIELMHLLHAEAGVVPASPGFRRRRIGACVPCARSSDPYSPGPCGTSTITIAARFQALRAAIRAPTAGCFHRFEHVHAQRAIELFRVHARVIGGIFRIELAYGYAGRPQEAVAQRVQIQRIFFAGDVAQLARHQPAGEIAESGADFEHRIAQMRAAARASASSDIAACRSGCSAIRGRRWRRTDRPPARNAESRRAPSPRPSIRFFSLLHKCGRDS